MTVENEIRQDDEVGHFQSFLDEHFPIGALCVEFIHEDDRLTETGLELITGRLICTEAEPRKNGGWNHRLLIDNRSSAEEGEQAEVWVSSIDLHPDSGFLWEARVVGSDEPRLLRLLADPKPPWRPTPSMRAAVSEAHGIDH